MAWKKTIATDHTEGEPPSRGSTILVNMGSIRNNSAALRKMAAMNVASGVSRDCAARLIVSAAEGLAMARVLARSVPRRELGKLGVSRPGPLAYPLAEIPEMLAQLLERKAEREQVLQRIARQGTRETFATNGRDLRGVALEGLVGGIQRRRCGARDEGRGAAAQVVVCGRDQAGERWPQARVQILRQRHHRRASDDHEGVAQPQQRAPERSPIGSVGELSHPLALDLGIDHVEPCDGFADALLDGQDRGRVERSREPPEQTLHPLPPQTAHARRAL